MTERRLYLAPESWAPKVVLADQQKRYLVDVLRLEPGTTIEVFDGQGGECDGTLELLDGTWVVLLGHRREAFEQWPRTCLACAVLKGRVFDDVLRMVSEIGVDTIWPMTTERVVPQLKGSRLDARMDRWRKIAAEAARQSGRSRVMGIEPIRTFADVTSLPHSGQGILLHPEGQTSLGEKLHDIRNQDRFVLVGPEGGFSPREVEEAKARGFFVCSLGHNVLRARTAMVVAAAFMCLLTR